MDGALVIKKRKKEIKDVETNVKNLKLNIIIKKSI